MVKYRQHPANVYASLLQQIKQWTDEASGDKHMNALEGLKNTHETIENERVSIEDMCRYTGHQSYHHNKYMVSVFYLTLGESYDGDIYPENEDNDLAKKYYSLSNQPPAKWRLARLYKSRRITPPTNNRDTDTIVGTLISEAINMLIIDDTYNQRYFGKRVEYLADMYEDLQDLETNQKEHYQLYFEILRWIINNEKNIRGDHQDTLFRFMEFDFECGCNSDNMTLDEFNNIVNS
jgi:quinol monooxygenase YgiN